MKKFWLLPVVAFGGILAFGAATWESKASASRYGSPRDLGGGLTLYIDADTRCEYLRPQNGAASLIARRSEDGLRHEGCGRRVQELLSELN